MDIALGLGLLGNITSKEKSYYTCNDPEFVGKKGGRKTGSGYKTCSEEMPIKFGCKNETIKYIQGPECLGITADGKFGPKTKAALTSKGFSSFTDADVEKICKTVVAPPKDEFVTQVDADDAEEILNT